MDKKDLLTQVIEHSEEKIYLINRPGLITVTARKSDHELIGTMIMDLISKPHINRLKMAISEALNSGKPVNCEVKGKFGGKKMGLHSCRISPILHGNKIGSAIIFASDLTAQGDLTQAEKIKSD